MTDLPYYPLSYFTGKSAPLADPVEYRKSGLSLNHIVGCPLECAYCVRHLFDNYKLKKPHLTMSDEDAVTRLLQHPHFRRNLTPLQLFNRATDPFLPDVKPHMFKVLELLETEGLTNHMLIITRYHITAQDCEILNRFKTLKVTLLVTRSGIEDKRIEPINSAIAATSLKTAFGNADSYRVIQYWRPVILGINDTDQHIEKAAELAHFSHATCFTGLFYREEIDAYFQEIGVAAPYDTARRKILPQELENKILEKFKGAPLFRKTSCAVSYAHGLADYNGHYYIRDICDICPEKQSRLCAGAYKIPTLEEVEKLAEQGGLSLHYPVTIEPKAVILSGFDEQQRYYLQHGLNFQVHDVRYPHKPNRHGRADIGWKETDPAG